MAEGYIPDQVRAGHAEAADGIEEYDNRLPTWWVGLFVLTIVWGAVVFADWHIISPKSVASIYDEEMVAAGPTITADQVAIVLTPGAIAEGATLYATHCVACHQADGTGGIGPSLTDDEWIYGNTPENIRDTIANGVLEKGMPAWLSVLGPTGLANVTAFVADLGGLADLGGVE